MKEAIVLSLSKFVWTTHAQQKSNLKNLRSKSSLCSVTLKGFTRCVVLSDVSDAEGASQRVSE